MFGRLTLFIKYFHLWVSIVIVVFLLLAIGEVTEMDTFWIEGTDKVMRGVDAPPGFWECHDLKQQEEHIKKNMRAILQLLNIKVIVFPERVEIKGTIPTQVLEKSINIEEAATAPIISSPSPILERGKKLKRGALPLLNTPKNRRVKERRSLSYKNLKGIGFPN